MSELTNVYIAEKIRNQFGEAILSASEPYDMLTIVVKPSIAHGVINWLKNDTEIKIQFLTDVCGAQFPEIEGQEFCVIYHLHSLTNNIRIRIKSFIPASNPIIATVSDLFESANWQERETYDFYGVIFEGHPNLTRILNVDEMDYFPLRKEYPLEDGTRTDKEDKYFGR